jgi:S-adenosylmethionine decarboxylase
MTIGKHLLADLSGIAADLLDDAALLSECLLAGAGACGLTPLAPPRLHCFEGGGVTGFLLLAESHIALHTYPEHGYIAVDIFSCGQSDPMAALQVFRDRLRPGREKVSTVTRGADLG